LSVAGDDLYVADTNNHRVVRVHLESHEWHEIAFEGLSAPATKESHESNALLLDPAELDPLRPAHFAEAAHRPRHAV
jgi:hypothetical protein